MSGRWEPDPDGEYNEQSITAAGKRVTIYSDRDGSDWRCLVEGWDAVQCLESTTLDEARAEALRLVSA